MRKNIFLLIAASALLVSCGSNESATSSSVESSTLSSTSSQDESSTEHSSSEESSSSNTETEEESKECGSCGWSTSDSSEETISDSSEEKSSSEEEISDDESSEEELEERTFKVQFKLFNGSKPTGDSDHNFLSVLEPYFLDDDYQLLEDVETPEGYFSQINEFSKRGEEDKVVPFTTLSLGSSSKYGELTFNFNYQITKVVVAAQAYHKFFSYTGYSGWSIDEDCVLGINDNTLSLPSAEEDEPEELIQTYDYEEGIDYLVLSTEGEGRVFVNSLEITYYA